MVVTFAKEERWDQMGRTNTKEAAFFLTDSAVCMAALSFAAAYRFNAGCLYQEGMDKSSIRTVAALRWIVSAGDSVCVAASKLPSDEKRYREIIVLISHDLSVQSNRIKRFSILSTSRQVPTPFKARHTHSSQKTGSMRIENRSHIPFSGWNECQFKEIIISIPSLDTGRFSSLAALSSKAKCRART